jgi:CBS domain-containing protein
MTLHEAARFLTDPVRVHPSFPVIDADGKVLGIMDPPSVIRWKRSGNHRNTPLAELLPRGIPVAYPDDYLESAMHQLSEANVAYLPVVARADQKLVGYLGWKDFMRAKTRLRDEEKNRTTFFRRSPRGKSILAKPPQP